MLLLATVALLQVAQPPRADTLQLPRSAAADSIAVRDSVRRERRNQVRRIPVTAEHLRTAFEDAGARTLLERAREARIRQDTALAAYDATTYQRISAGMGIRRFGRERLLFRQEEATRVRWRRGEGAVVDVIGSRQAVPSGKGGLQVGVDVDGDMGPIPYFPGQETLWMGSDLAKREVNDREIVHPLAEGSEAYYRFRSGDSVTVRLQGGRDIKLRELKIRPREPKWNLAVGSLWFDTENAQLVRAVYRLSVPLELWDVVKDVEDGDDDDVPGWVKALVNPLRATVSAVTIEYGLEGGRFWLPRSQAMEAEAQAAFMRIPVHFEQSFRYTSVSGSLDSAAALPVIPVIAEEDTKAWRDSVRALPPAERDSARARRRAASRGQCDTGDTRSTGGTRFDGALAVISRIPCDTLSLATSAALPESIFDEGDLQFDQRMQDALVEASLALGDQAMWAPQLPTLKYGLGDGLLRYNRVEGVSPALAAEMQLGRGYQARALARIGTADWQPNAELTLTRTDGRRTLNAGVYRRLAASNDWGEPLGLSSSLSALLFGRDEGFYYRSWGAEIGGLGTGRRLGDGTFSWRLFSERHDAADVETQFAFYNRIADEHFLPNIVAEEGSVTGMGARWVRTFGLDPRQLRLLADVRGEGGVGSFNYGRGLVDLTLSRGFGELVDGALTMSAGSTVGEVPVQRQFFLGGPQSIRGQDGGAMIGDAYWMTRAELTTSAIAFRPVLFYDLGWAGARGDWRSPGRLASGGGAGLSVLDGLFRFDLSRGIYPQKQWRFDMYMEARF